jgi:hypothetical protein
MTTATGLTGGRENADNFAGYVAEDDDDNPIGGRGGHGCTGEVTREEDGEEGGGGGL